MIKKTESKKPNYPEIYYYLPSVEEWFANMEEIEEFAGLDEEYEVIVYKPVGKQTVSLNAVFEQGDVMPLL